MNCCNSSEAPFLPNLCFQCSSDHFIPLKFFCDGNLDCNNFSDEISSDEHKCKVSLVGAEIFIFSLITLLLFCAFLITMFVFKYRDTPIVKYSSPTYCYLTIAGIVISYASIIPFLLPVTQEICITRMWLPNIAFILLYG